jgi:hypothetical protein
VPFFATNFASGWLFFWTAKKSWKLEVFKFVFHNFLKHFEFLKKQSPAWHIFQSCQSFLLLFYILGQYLQSCHQLMHKWCYISKPKIETDWNQQFVWQSKKFFANSLPPCICFYCHLHTQKLEINWDCKQVNQGLTPCELIMISAYNLTLIANKNSTHLLTYM